VKWLGRLLRWSELDVRLDEEMQDHIERQVADNLRAGMTEAEARRSALLAFGGIDEAKEGCRDARGTRWAHVVSQDIRYALRGFRRTPRFALSAVLTIALAIGGAAAVFSVADRSLFRPLPYAYQDRLVSIGITAPLVSPQDWIFQGTYLEWGSSKSAFESITAWRGVNDCDRNDGAPQRLRCAEVEASFLPTLGVTLAAGRNFTEAEDRPGGDPVAMLTHSYWISHFGGGNDVLGKRMTLDGEPARIVGVLPAGFETPTLARADVLRPMRMRRDSQRQQIVYVIGRMPTGMTPLAASATLAGPFQQFLQSTPPDFRKAAGLSLRVASLREQQTRGYKQALWMLLGAVLAFVLIACSNVAHLLLARAAARRHEFAVRASMGASRWRLAGQALVESLVLGAAGGALGWPLGYGLLRLFQSMAPEGVLRMGEARMDGRVLLFALGLSAATALLFGMAPALERLRGEALAGARAVGRSRGRMRPLLVAGQMAFSVVLLMVSGLFLLSLWKLQNARLGFAPEKAVTATFTLPALRYASGERLIGFFRDLERQLSEMPGAVSAAITDSLPPGGDPRSRPYVAMIGGGDRSAPGMGGLVKWRYVTRGYFRALNIPIVRGRGFTDEDLGGAEQAIVMSESLARRLYGQADPTGRTVRLEASMKVVGVAADVMNAGVGGALDGEFYVLRGDSPTGVFTNQRPPYGWRRATAVVRTTMPVESALDALRDRVLSVEPGVALELGTLYDEVSRFYARPRFQTALLTVFALVGLALAAVGLYGLTSFLVVERTREAGVRIALGASPLQIVRLMMGEGMRWTLAGLVVGSVLSAWLFRLIRTLLFEAPSFEVRVFAGAMALLLAVAVLASWLPSARAARMDPMAALRQE